jgi:flagellar hook-associated protein 2
MEVTTASIVSSLGAGGAGLTGLADQLAVAQFAARNERLGTQSETLERRISAAGSIRSNLALFASSLGDRLRTGDLAPAPSISNSAIASVSTPAGAIGQGSYSLEVTSLASNQVVASPAYASEDDTVGAGTLTFRFGETSNASFSEDPDSTALAIDIAAGATLADVAIAINTAGAGLNAYVAQTSAGAQLVIKGEEGLQNGFTITATEDGANPGLSALDWQPGSDPTRLIQTSQDAAFILDGLARTSASNSIDSVAPGLSLELTGTNVGAPATIGFSSSTSAITGVMQDITGALNEIVAELDAATDALNGDLARDSGARALAFELSGLGSLEIMPNAADGSPRTLAEIGLSIERNGSFTLDTETLNEVLARDPSGVAAMFTTGINGIYSTVERISRENSLSSDPGTLAGSIARYETQAQEVSRDLEELAEKQEEFRANMVARFARVDSQVAASQSTLSFLEAQIDAWNAQNN